MEWRIETEAALQQYIPEMLNAIGDRRKIALYGDLGAGKTAFVKAFCRHLGVTDEPNSPTFSLVNEYECDKNGQTEKIHHLDLYRLESIEEALDIGIEELLESPFYCFIEWPELIEPILPDDAVKIRIELIGESVRRLLIL